MIHQVWLKPHRPWVSFKKKKQILEYTGVAIFINDNFFSGFPVQRVHMTLHHIDLGVDLSLLQYRHGR